MTNTVSLAKTATTTNSITKAARNLSTASLLTMGALLEDTDSHASTVLFTEWLAREQANSRWANSYR